MSTQSNKARTIFLEAIEQHSAEMRASFLDDACGGDSELRERVERLLRSHELLGSFHEDPRPAAPTLDQGVTEAPGTVIGPYKLLQQIGEGGMGVVYMAEQTEPVERRVALKIVKPGMDTRQVVARFEAERHALARMDHPNIARVLDAGTTGDSGKGDRSNLCEAPEGPFRQIGPVPFSAGRPYFVMELVKGVPITQYCDEHHLTPQERLELFVPVCHAVQHAHQKGIIHRDIKPTNVLVAEYDDRPAPKIIDFGVAKAIQQRLTERSVFTQLGQVVGTVDYMSPEQAKLNELDVDTRSDVYSLGVLLYELLTGETPFDRQRLRSAAFDELLRIIREEDPPKPSLRLSSSESLPSIAANRQIEPKKLSTMVRGELDWIVMKALEKDRSRRYETANGFAADIERYLSDEPVLACPPSAGYRLRKFMRRNKARLAVVGLVLFLLILLVGGAGWLLRDREARREQMAQQARESLTRARQWAGENNLTLAREELTAAKGRMGSDRAVLGGLVEEIDALETELARYERFLNLVAQAHEAEFPQPVALPLGAGSAGGSPVASAQATGAVRERDKAVPFLRGALSCYGILEQEDWTTRLEGALLESNQVARVRKTAYEELLWLADDVARRGVDHGSGQKMSPHEAAEAGLAYLRRAEAAHRPTAAFYLIRARLLKGAGKEAEASRDEALARRTPATIALDHYLLAVAAYGARNKAEAVVEFQEALRVEPTHYWSLLGLACALSNLAQEEPDFTLAAAAYTGCILKRPEHATAYVGRGYAYLRLGRYKEAEADFRQALRLRPEFPSALSDLGYALWKQGRNAEAEAVCREAIRLEPGYPRAYYALGLVLYWGKETHAAAARFYAEAFAAHPELADELSSPNRYVAACHAALAGCGQGEDATKLDDTQRARWRRQALDWLGADLAAWGRLLQEDPQQARARAHETLRSWQQDADFAGVRGDGLAALPEAEQRAWQQFWEDVERTLSAPQLKWDDPRTWLDYARSLDQSGKHEEARQFRAQARAVCQKDPALIRDNPDYAAAYVNLLLKDGVAPGTVLSLPWQKADLRIRYPQRRAKIPPNPILYFTFDEDTVQELGDLVFAADLSGNGFHGTGQGVSSSPSGKVGGCLVFRGGKLRLPSSLMNRLSEYTFTAWMWREPDGGPGYREYQYVKNPVYGVRDDMFVNTWNRSRKPDYWKSGQPAGLVLPRGQWYFAAVRLRNGGVDQGTVDVFVNGNRYQIPGQRMEGHYSATGEFHGQAGMLDEVAVYDRALSDDEIRALSEQTADVPAPPKEHGK